VLTLSSWANNPQHLLGARFKANNREHLLGARYHTFTSRGSNAHNQRDIMSNLLITCREKKSLHTGAGRFLRSAEHLLPLVVPQQASRQQQGKNTCTSCARDTKNTWRDRPIHIHTSTLKRIWKAAYPLWRYINIGGDLHALRLHR